MHSISTYLLSGLALASCVTSRLTTRQQTPLQAPNLDNEASSGSNTLSSENKNISAALFNELEEFSRIVDIAYCVGVTGIYHPFECAGRCSEFPGWELVDTWNTGPLMSDSCGYVALDHEGERIIVAFRGTYSIANTIVDLSTVPQEYVPYPGNPDDPEDPESGGGGGGGSWWDRVKHPFGGHGDDEKEKKGREGVEAKKQPEHKCENCTVHSGFFTSWQNTRRLILPLVSSQRSLHPSYKVHLVGHSLGGAVAALAAIEFELLDWNPTITTFGEPRIGNIGLRNWLDKLFNLGNEDENGGRYRRITHIDDPVPLLPLAEWGFRMHAGEIYISKPSLSPALTDLSLCTGDEDPSCIAGGDEPAVASTLIPLSSDTNTNINNDFDILALAEKDLIEANRWGLPARYKMWQLFFAHRDYFWRIGLCVPGGDPYDWGRGKYGGDGKGVDDEGSGSGIGEDEFVQLMLEL